MCAVSSYVLLHASRKTFSNVKVSISAQWTPPFSNASASPVEVGEWVQRRIQNIIAPEILFSPLALRLRLMSDCDCLRAWTATPCLQMKSRPRCSWELWTPSSSSHMLWWVANTMGLGEGRGRKYLLLLYDAISQWTLVSGPVSQRRDWRQSEPSLRPLFRPVRLRCGGEFTSAPLFSEACCDCRVPNRPCACRSLSSARWQNGSASTTSTCTAACGCWTACCSQPCGLVWWLSWETGSESPGVFVFSSFPKHQLLLTFWSYFAS